MTTARLWTRRLRWRSLFLLVLFSFVSSTAARAAEPPYRVYEVRHTIAPTGEILLTYGVESASYPVVKATGGSTDTVVVEDGAGGWRMRVNATLDPCRGSLAVATLAQPDWRVLIQQECDYIPIGARS